MMEMYYYTVGTKSKTTSLISLLGNETNSLVQGQFLAMFTLVRFYQSSKLLYYVKKSVLYFRKVPAKKVFFFLHPHFPRHC